MIDLMNIIYESKKYHYVTFRENKPVKHDMFDKKQVVEMKKNDTVIYIRLRTLNKEYYLKEKKSPFKTTGGPLYAELNIYKNENNKIIKIKPKSKNKIFFPKKYLQLKMKNHTSYKWMAKDIIKCAKLYFNDKLKQTLVAINRITDF